MNEDLKQAFVDETSETLTALNNELLELESRPDDPQVMDAIFRRAHTLKGNLGAMGFDDAADLAHAMEDLLDGIRTDQIEVSAATMDALFDAVDALEATTQAVVAETAPEVDIEAIATSLRSHLEAGTGGDEDIASSGPSVGGDVVVHLEPGDLPGADAALVLEQLDTAVDDYETDPPRETLLDGDYDTTIAISTEDTEEVTAILEGLRVVEDIELTADDEPTTASDNDTPDLGGSTEVRSIRIDADRLDALHGLVETLVTAKIAIDRGIHDEDLDAAADGLNTVDKALTQLQAEVMDMRLVPLDHVFSSLPRLVRDLSRSTEKEVELTIEGADVELDRTIVNRLDDPLVHLVRNAIDHGIETPSDRTDAGKPETGHLAISARRDRDTVEIVIEDDGRGMDPDTIRSIAAERGVESEATLAEMPDEEVFDLVFEPGFSTAEEVTDVSGRGVGMDAVNSVVTELEGSIDVDSEPGVGTTVTLRLPVDVAIDDVLFVTIDDQHVGIPVRTIAEIDAVDVLDDLHGEPVVDPGDGYIPVVDLGEALSTALTDGGSSTDDRRMLVRIRPETRDIALACDGVDEQEEVVIRPLEGILQDTEGLSGTTVLGNGNVVPIIDIQTL